jgi:hypothetical protein
LLPWQCVEYGPVSAHWHEPVRTLKNDLYLSGAFAAACWIALRECKHAWF